MGTGIACSEASHIAPPSTASGSVTFCHIFLSFHLLRRVMVLQVWLWSQQQTSHTYICSIISTYYKSKWLTMNDNYALAKLIRESKPNAFLQHTGECAFRLLYSFVWLLCLDCLEQTWWMLITQNCYNMFLKEIYKIRIWVGLPATSCPVILSLMQQHLNYKPDTAGQIPQNTWRTVRSSSLRNSIYSIL